MEISPAIIHAIEVLKTVTESDVTLISEEMIRIPTTRIQSTNPDFEIPKRLGAKISILGVNFFLEQEMAEDLLTPIGKRYAEEIIFNIKRTLK